MNEGFYHALLNKSSLLTGKFDSVSSCGYHPLDIMIGPPSPS